jgi:glycosyltransferase involved in cell wall biosynthesis
VRIAYVVTRADSVGGASIHVRDLAAAMLDRGHDVTVLVGGSGPVTDQLALAGVPYLSLRHLARPIRPLADARAFRELVAVLRELRPDLVSTHTAKAGWIGRAACARLSVPALFTAHGWSITDRISRAQGLAFRLAERTAARWARAIICVCEHEKQLALEHGIAPEKKLIVIHNGVRDVRTEFRACPSRQPARIVSIARFAPPKDHAALLRALATLRSLDWELDLIGDGPLQPEIADLASSLGISDRVRMCGYLSDPAASLAQAQIFALCSRFEGFPRSVLEAMRAGLPVVASDVGGVREAVEDGGSGLLVPGNSPQEMAGRLAQLIKDPPLRERFGRAGRLTYESRFRLERLVEATGSVYDTIVSGPPRGRGNT